MRITSHLSPHDSRLTGSFFLGSQGTSRRVSLSHLTRLQARSLTDVRLPATCAHFQCPPHAGSKRLRERPRGWCAGQGCVSRPFARSNVTASTLISSSAGISGGEKRRLSLAVQMISDPSVLVVDEVGSSLYLASSSETDHLATHPSAHVGTRQFHRCERHGVSCAFLAQCCSGSLLTLACPADEHRAHRSNRYRSVVSTRNSSSLC